MNSSQARVLSFLKTLLIMLKQLPRIKLSDHRATTMFYKALDALHAHSDTAFLSLLQNQFIVSVLDSESFCAAELRVSSSNLFRISSSQGVCGQQICLETFVAQIKQAMKSKVKISIVFENSHIFLVNDTKKTKHAVKILPWRSLRNFVFLHKESFETKSRDDYSAFTIDRNEFNKIITAQTILTGQSKSVCTLSVHIPQEENKPLPQAEIVFHIQNQSGVEGLTTISTPFHTPQINFLVVQSAPSVSAQYFISYMKRSQHIFGLSDVSTVTVLVSSLGIFCESHVSEGVVMSVFVRNIASDDLDSYV